MEELGTCIAREPSWLEMASARIKRLFEKKKPGNLHFHALREFKAAGYAPIEECEDDPNKWIQQNVLELLEVFSKQGHSGFSAPYCIKTFEKLARYEPLVPLSGNDDEWNDVSDYGGRDGGKVYQNNRCSHVFKEGDGRAYDIDAVVYLEPSGAGFTRGGERHYIEFPYTPTRQTIKVNFDGNPVSDEEWSRLAKEHEARAE